MYAAAASNNSCDDVYVIKSGYVDLTRFDGHLTSPRLRVEVYDEISEEGQRAAAA
jgi:hypothetical protein